MKFLTDLTLNPEQIPVVWRFDEYSRYVPLNCRIDSLLFLASGIEAHHIWFLWISTARMESNGKPGSIHVSQSTADCLIASGKGRWLTPREDTIIAKGLGEMNTYWVKVLAESVGTGTSTSAHTRTCTSSQCSNDDMGVLEEEGDEFAEDIRTMPEEIKLEFENFGTAHSNSDDAGLDDDEFAQAVRRRTQEQAPPTLLSSRTAAAWDDGAKA